MKLYHRTTKDRLPSVFSDGLIPSGMGIVYLSERDDLTNYGDVLLEVETGENRLTSFDGTGSEVLCWGNIPPDDITVIQAALGVKPDEGKE